MSILQVWKGQECIWRILPNTENVRPNTMIHTLTCSPILVHHSLLFSNNSHMCGSCLIWLCTGHTATVYPCCKQIKVEGAKTYFYIPKYRSSDAIPAPEIFSFHYFFLFGQIFGGFSSPTALYGSIPVYWKFFVKLGLCI